MSYSAVFSRLFCITKDLEQWVKSLNEVQDHVNTSTQQLEQQEGWKNISCTGFGYLIKYASMFYNMAEKEITEILKEMQVEIQSHHVSRLRRLHKTASKLFVKFGIVWHQEVIDAYPRWLDNSAFGIVEALYAEGRNMAIDMIDLSNLAERLEDFVGKKRSGATSSEVQMNFYGSVSGAAGKVEGNQSIYRQISTGVASEE